MKNKNVLNIIMGKVSDKIQRVIIKQETLL